MPDFTKPWCYTIVETEFDDGRGFVPSIVFADEPGHYPMRGADPSSQQPYYWGKTLERARAVAANANEDRGLTPEQVDEIIASSMRLSFS